MKYLLIYCTFVVVGIFFDFIRLLLAKVLKFEVEEFSVFMGPKLINTIMYNTEYSIRAIPCGSYMKFKESFLERDRLSKMIVAYSPEIILFITACMVINHTTNDIFVISSKILIFINGFFVIKSIIFDNNHIFYRYKK